MCLLIGSCRRIRVRVRVSSKYYKKKRKGHCHSLFFLLVNVILPLPPCKQLVQLTWVGMRGKLGREKEDGITWLSLWVDDGQGKLRQWIGSFFVTSALTVNVIRRWWDMKFALFPFLLHTIVLSLLVSVIHSMYHFLFSSCSLVQSKCTLSSLVH